MNKPFEARDKQIIFDGKYDDQQVAHDAIADPDILRTLVESLGDANRRIRQFSASAVRQVAQDEPGLLVNHIDSLADALFRPEAQTRWEILEALILLMSFEPQTAGAAFEGAQDALYDEESGAVRLAAFKYFAHLGAINMDWAQKVWPYLDETIQCYHGDNEFAEMLGALNTSFVEGLTDLQIAQALRERLAFDAEQGKGYIKRQAALIVDALNAKKEA